MSLHDQVRDLTRQASSAFNQMVEQAIGDVLLREGLWDGREETKVAAAHAVDGRIYLESHPDDIMKRVVVMDGEPRWVIEAKWSGAIINISRRAA